MGLLIWLSVLELVKSRPVLRVVVNVLLSTTNCCALKLNYHLPSSLERTSVKLHGWHKIMKNKFSFYNFLKNNRQQDYVSTPISSFFAMELYFTTIDAASIISRFE